MEQELSPLKRSAMQTKWDLHW